MAADYYTVIGLEVHAQLLTASKMFCSCRADVADLEPNTAVCPVCLGLPGVLPVANRAAVEMTLRTGLALGSTIADATKWDRKNYSYPDLVKWYQISQYDLPLCLGGQLEVVDPDGATRRIGITRVHLEEDTARMIHDRDPDGLERSLVDVNRSGIALMEIVSEPDIDSPRLARSYLRELRDILVHLEVSSGEMQEGAFRCDANISIWPMGQPMGNSKVEIKNMNSFRAVQRALAYEEVRQRQVWEDTQAPPMQETRGWSEARGQTLSQRIKEDAHDYRYFPDPDLPPLHVAGETVQRLRSRMPALPRQIRTDLATAGIVGADADQLVSDRELLAFFQEARENYPDARRLANRVLNELVQHLRAEGSTLADGRVTAGGLVELLELEDAGRVSVRMAAEILKEMVISGRSAAELASKMGEQISDADALRTIVREVIAANPQAEADYKAGKKQAAGFLVGQVMKATRGKANPGVVNREIATELSQ